MPFFLQIEDKQRSSNCFISKILTFWAHGEGLIKKIRRIMQVLLQFKSWQMNRPSLLVSLLWLSAVPVFSTASLLELEVLMIVSLKESEVLMMPTMMKSEFLTPSVKEWEIMLMSVKKLELLSELLLINLRYNENSDCCQVQSSLSSLSMSKL